MTETEIRTRYITPAIQNAGWPIDVVCEEFFFFTKGRIEVCGRKTVRGNPTMTEKFADLNKS